MLKALYITGAIAVFFLLLSLIKITIAISYVNDLVIFIKIGLFKIRVFPFEQQTPREKSLKKAKKEKRKQRKIKIRQKPARPKPTLKETILLIKDYLYNIIGKFGRYMKLEEYRLKVLVATEDPAKTGVFYGAVCAAAASLSLLVEKIKRKTSKKGMIYTEVKPDFLAEEPEIFISVALSMRIWQMFSMGITASKGFLRYNALINEKSEKKKAEPANKEQ